ncbi:uncharacterized protein TNCV_206921, partial [Trichonephila clavipes]
LSGSVSCFPPPQVLGSINGLDKVDSAFHPHYIGSINEYQAAWGLKLYCGSLFRQTTKSGHLFMHLSANGHVYWDGHSSSRPSWIVVPLSLSFKFENYKKHTVIPPLHGPSGMAYSDFEKAEAFKDTHEVTFQENAEPYSDDKIEEVESLVNHYFDNFNTHIPPLTSPLRSSRHH